MSVAKTIEITSASRKSFDDAIRQGIARVDESVRDVTDDWVKDQDPEVSQERITRYLVRMRVTFILN